VAGQFVSHQRLRTDGAHAAEHFEAFGYHCPCPLARITLPALLPPAPLYVSPLLLPSPSPSLRPLLVLAQRLWALKGRSFVAGLAVANFGGSTLALST
jgi:hypothetical protein